MDNFAVSDQVFEMVQAHKFADDDVVAFATFMHDGCFLGGETEGGPDMTEAKWVAEVFLCYLKLRGLLADKEGQSCA